MAVGIKFSGEVIGADKLAAKLSAMPRTAGRGLERGLELAGMAVKAKAQDNLSGRILDVKTGHLRGSILSTVSKAGFASEVIVGTPVIYGATHEFGGPRNVAVRWLQTSFEQVRQQLMNLINREVDRAVSR